MQPNIVLQNESVRYRLFLTTNEQDQAKTIKGWTQLKSTGNTIIGVSAFFTLNLASRWKTEEQKLNIVMVDPQPKMQQFWQNVKENVLECNDRRDCALRISQHISKKEHANMYFPNGFEDSEAEIQKLQSEIKKKLSWLSTERQYAQIKEIFQNNRFFFVQADLCKEDDRERLIILLNENNLVPDTIYLSNVREYAQDEDKSDGYRAAVKAFKELVPIGAKFIDTFPRDSSKKPLKQRLSSYQPKI